MRSFKLIVLDPKHLILTTERVLTRDETQGIAEAFARWKAEGGVAILGDCVVENKNAIEISLDLPTPAEVRHERLLEGLPIAEDGVTDEASDEFVRSHGGR